MKAGRVIARDIDVFARIPGREDADHARVAQRLDRIMQCLARRIVQAIAVARDAYIHAGALHHQHILKTFRRPCR